MNASRLIFSMMQSKGLQVRFGKSILQIKHSLQPRSYFKSSRHLNLTECIIHRGSFCLQTTPQLSNYVYFCTSKKSMDMSTDAEKEEKIENEKRTTSKEKADIEKEVQNADSWKLIYNLEGAQKAQRMQVFARAQVIMSLAAIPTILIFNPGNQSLFLGLLLFFATQLILSAAKNVRRFIVSIYVDETYEKLRFTMIDSWGRKVDLHKNTSDVMPLSDFRKFENNKMLRVMTYQKEEYILVPQFITQENMEDMKKILGDFKI